MFYKYFEGKVLGKWLLSESDQISNEEKDNLRLFVDNYG